MRRRRRGGPTISRACLVHNPTRLAEELCDAQREKWREHLRVRRKKRREGNAVFAKRAKNAMFRMKRSLSGRNAPVRGSSRGCMALNKKTPRTLRFSTIPPSSAVIVREDTLRERASQGGRWWCSSEEDDLVGGPPSISLDAMATTETWSSTNGARSMETTHRLEIFRISASSGKPAVALDGVVSLPRVVAHARRKVYGRELSER